MQATGQRSLQQSNLKFLGKLLKIIGESYLFTFFDQLEPLHRRKSKKVRESIKSHSKIPPTELVARFLFKNSELRRKSIEQSHHICRQNYKYGRNELNHQWTLSNFWSRCAAIVWLQLSDISLADYVNFPIEFFFGYLSECLIRVLGNKHRSWQQIKWYVDLHSSPCKFVRLAVPSKQIIRYSRRDNSFKSLPKYLLSDFRHTYTNTKEHVTVGTSEK